MNSRLVVLEVGEGVDGEVRTHRRPRAGERGLLREDLRQPWVEQILPEDI